MDSESYAIDTYPREEGYRSLGSSVGVAVGGGCVGVAGGRVEVGGGLVEVGGVRVCVDRAVGGMLVGGDVACSCGVVSAPTHALRTSPIKRINKAQ